jgi:hypothetical protein
VLCHCTKLTHSRHLHSFRVTSSCVQVNRALLPAMRILIAGASGVLGRATLPHLFGHDVVALTRTREKVQLLRGLGAEPIVCDVYDAVSLLRVTQRARPHTVVNFLTDLAEGSAQANNRIRREGAANLLEAATAARAARLVVESVAFPLAGEAGKALEHLERSTRTFPGEAVILRFGRLWGAETLHKFPPEPPAIHIDKAGAEAARLIRNASTGTYVVT